MHGGAKLQVDETDRYTLENAILAFAYYQPDLDFG